MSRCRDLSCCWKRVFSENEWFYEDLQNLLELAQTQKDVLFILEGNTKIGSQEISGVTAKFGLGIQNEAGQKLTKFVKRMHWSQQHTLPTAVDYKGYLNIIH